MDLEFLAAKARWVRQTVVRMAYKANSGHLSTAFSQAEMLCALYYGGILNYDAKNPKWEDRDRFILSKGQGGIGLYPILSDVGYFPKEALDNFCGPGSFLGVHSEFHCPGIEVLTGSLGHGLGIAVGMALAAKQAGKKHLVICMVGDGELYEGSNWEAMFTAAHHKLNRLILIVDRNKQATIGRLEDIKGVSDGPRQDSLKAKLDAFGFDAIEINGHDFIKIFGVLDPKWLHQPREYGPQTDIDDDEFGRPMCIISNTVKGKGFSLMENQSVFPTHYFLVRGEELKTLLRELGMDADEFKEYVGRSDVLGY